MASVAASNRQLSIIIPTLNEAGCIQTTLAQLQPLRLRGHEIILVDGGSTDATLALSLALVDRVVQTPAGRGWQMQAGAAVACGTVLWFLHADSSIPATADTLILDTLHRTQTGWGRFDISFTDNHPLLKCVAWFMNHRTRFSGIATGDQGIFVARTLYDRVGGFPSIPLMEDISFSRKLKRHGRPCRITQTLGTSPRRWHTHGILRTIVTMWGLRLAYFAGISPERLAKYYSVTSG
ncbi:MAG: TIGR04283 family arsenosugar biosynthesis glycosyltransferase [Gammaproteobacteria bacterium]|jgi:rSAM/selenodomain-associated transferase 2|nr:TIGR04283 family arsenosugar biosynthesis glycosyltransferase [Gammaproteobacteria bacterium]